MVWFQTFIDQYQESIIKRIVDNAKKSSEFNPDIDFYKNGKHYFQLLVDIEIPIKDHPEFRRIPDICKNHAENGLSMDFVLHNIHLFKDSLFAELHSYSVENQIHPDDMFNKIQTLHSRIDQFTSLVIGLFWKHTMEIENKRKMDELHNDRLNMLGKMAASMAHEIRNPLFAIQGFLQLIKEDSPCLTCGTYENIQRYIDIIEHEFEGLYRQITSFLSFSKNFDTEESYVECSVKEIIDPVIDLIQPRTVYENVEITLEVDTTSPMLAQKIAIQQVLSNLLNNSIDALNHVDYPKKITIRCWEDAEHHYISVTDNGPGIPQALQKSIFEPFVTGKATGTGLGLAICKQIIEKHQGDLNFTSDQEKTVFTFSVVKKIRE